MLHGIFYIKIHSARNDRKRQQAHHKYVRQVTCTASLRLNKVLAVVLCLSGRVNVTSGGAMFDVRSYAVLLNEFFETGMSCEQLTACIRDKLAAENESVTPVDHSSSRLHLILNNNKVMFVFTALTGGEVRLHRQFREKIKEVGKTEFLPAIMDGKKCFGLFVDGKMVCAVTPASPGEKDNSENVTIH